MANPKKLVKQQVKAIKKQTKVDKKQLKQQAKVDKAQLNQDTQQQKYDLSQKNKLQTLENNNIRQEAQDASRYIPYNARDIATATHSTEDQPVSIRNTTPEQDAILKNLYQRLPQGIQGLNMPGNGSSFDPIANEARRNFSENSLPTLAERFAGLGRNSSGLQNTLSDATSQFESQLAAAKAQFGLQEQSLQSSNLFNSLGAFLHPQLDTTIVPGSDSALRSGWNGAKGLAYDAAVNAISPGGAAANLFKGMFGRNGSQQQNQPVSNGTGAGSNSAGFSGVNKAPWQPTQNQLSTQSLAGGTDFLQGLGGNNPNLNAGNPRGVNKMLLQGLGY